MPGPRATNTPHEASGVGRPLGKSALAEPPLDRLLASANRALIAAALPRSGNPPLVAGDAPTGAVAAAIVADN